MAEPTQAEIKKAIKAKGINQPIMKAEKKGKTLTLYLLGGKVVKYSLPSSK
ncbi:MAG: hypothetical protein ACYTFW_05095 [Planctomycetota bacterium]|jgi:hypothetical protein